MCTDDHIHCRKLVKQLGTRFSFKFVNVGEVRLVLSYDSKDLYWSEKTPWLKGLETLVHRFVNKNHVRIR